MKQFTSGPWAASLGNSIEDHRYYVASGRETKSGWTFYDNHIAWVSEEADANLIAVSPDLLELCRSFVDCQDETAPTAFNMRFDTACAKARDIIAKAEGKA